MKNATAEEEYLKDSELKREDVAELVKWTKTQPHLPLVTEFEAIQFLHSNYFDIEKAKNTIENYYTFRTKFTELFTNLNIESDEMFNSHQNIGFSVLPGTTPEGYRVLFFKLLDPDPKKCFFEHNNKLMFMYFSAVVKQLGICPGYIMLFDMEHIQFAHMFRASFTLMKHQSQFVQEALPIRLKVLEHINIPHFIDRLHAIFRPFMKKELLDLARYRKNIEDSYESIPPEMFPSDYPNGKAPSINELCESSWKMLLSRKDEFLSDEKLKHTDESKRIQDNKGLWGWFGY